MRWQIINSKQKNVELAQRNQRKLRNRKNFGLPKYSHEMFFKMADKIPVSNAKTLKIKDNSKYIVKSKKMRGEKKIERVNTELKNGS